MMQDWQRSAERTYKRIKAFYLSQGRTEPQWQAVSADLQKFNRIWRAMLRLPINDNPPPEGQR